MISDLDGFTFDTVQGWDNEPIGKITNTALLEKLISTDIKSRTLLSALMFQQVSASTVDKLLDVKQTHAVVQCIINQRSLSNLAISTIIEKYPDPLLYTMLLEHTNIGDGQVVLILDYLKTQAPGTYINERISRDPQLGPLFDMFSISPGHVFSQAGLTINSLGDAKTPKQLCKQLIGTAHPCEVDMLFFSGRHKYFNGYLALTNLQVAFTNTRKGKVDRYSYIKFLKVGLKGPNLSWLGTVSGIHLKKVIEHIGMSIVLKVGCCNKETEAADIIAMMSNLLNEKGTAPDAKKRKLLLLNWLEQNNTTGDKLHRYLMRKSNEKAKQMDLNSPFPQAAAFELVDTMNSELANYSIFLPTNHNELLLLGKAQRHCVGSQHFSELLYAGVGVIFSLVPKKANGIQMLQQGFTFHFDGQGKMMQAKGFENQDVSKIWVEQAIDLERHIRSTMVAKAI